MFGFLIFNREKRQKYFLQLLVKKIFYALKWYHNKNPQFSHEDGVRILKTYATALEQIENGKVTK